MFRKEADFEAFERVIVETHERQPIRILSYCVLSNHWHFVVWPEEDGQLTDFFRRLTHMPCGSECRAPKRIASHLPSRRCKRDVPTPDHHRSAR